LDDHQVGPKSAAKMTDPIRMRLDGDNPCAQLDKSCADGAVAGADIEYEVAGFDFRVSDEPLGPPGVELVPSPPARWRGHGCAPS
jgi:hypothetical protein